MITKQTILENLDQIKKYISEIESKKEMKIDTKYWIITSENTKEWYLWLDDRMDYDRLNNHNIYLNQDDCDKQIAKNEALNKIKTYIKDNFGEWTPDWNTEEEKKFFIYYSYDSKQWRFDVRMTSNALYLLPVLKSQSQAEQLINDCEKELNILIDNV